MSRTAVLVAIICLTVSAAPSFAQEEPWLADRGPGIPTSLFGTYITKGEFLVYPFYEYTKNTGEEYNPAELGADWTETGEYLGTLVEHEYLKRVSPKWRMVGSLEGEDDEVSLIGEAQWFVSRRTFFKFNCGFGLSEKAPDIAPEIGVMFSF